MGSSRSVQIGHVDRSQQNDTSEEPLQKEHAPLWVPTWPGLCNFAQHLIDDRHARGSPQVYAHHIVSNLQQSAESGCVFSVSIFKCLSKGRLLRPNPDEHLARVGFDELVRKTISAFCEEKA